MRAFLFLPCLAMLSGFSASTLPAQTHPRLFFNSSDVSALRGKANTAPWSDMLATAELAATVQDGSFSWFPRPHYYATLYLFTGTTSHAEKARDQVLQIISSSWWATSSGNALDQGTASGQVAVAYDLCFPAWVGQTVPATVINPVTGSTVTVATKWVGMDLNTAVSQALRENADRLIASGGSGWPGDTKTGNNWWAVRYGGAGLGYLATDDTVSSTNFNTAVTKLIQHFKANLGSGADSRGWNVEGIGYLGFPGQTSMPFVLALRRNANSALGSAHLNRNLVNDIPGLAHTLLTSYPGAIAQTKRHPYYNDTNRPAQNLTFSGIGLRPEFNDDHPNLQPEGTAALAFALVPSEYHAGMKWMFRRFWGDLGDRTWDSTSGHSLWSLLYYPDSLAEQNPAQSWGLAWKDPSMGMFVLRNRYQDALDSVFQATANLRDHNGGHGGADDLSFRLWSLGVPWVVGAGRNYDAPVSGQTTLSVNDPSTANDLVPAINNTVVDSLLRAAGDGYLVLHSDQIQTGVEDLTRRYAVDYNSAQTGAAATVIISDSSANAAFWRMNTPSFNTIATNNATRTFTFTAPDGKTLRGRVVWPETVSFRTNGTTLHDRTHVRFPYKDINYTGNATGWDTTVPNNSTGNNWVDFQTPDGKAVVVLTVVDQGQTQPVITSSGAGNNQTITVGSRTFTLVGNTISAAGWERPNVAITTPTTNQNFNAGATTVSLTGTASVPSGSANTLARVEIYLDDLLQGNAILSSGTWSYSLSSVAVGAHTVTARAIDSAANEREVKTPFRVNNSIPPSVALTWPGPSHQLYDQQSVTLRGTVSDPDGTISKVEIYWAGSKLGDATLGTGTAAGTWSYTVSKRNTGTYSLYARAIDNTTDATDTPTHTLTFSRFFSDVPLYGDAGRYSASATDTTRWTTYVDETGNTRFRVRNTPNTWSDLFNQLPDSTYKHWRLTYKAKSDLPLSSANAYYMVGLTGDNKRSLVMDTIATVKGPAWGLIADGTRVTESVANGTGILPTLKWHPTLANGSANANLVAGDPLDTNGEYRGIPNDGWNNVTIQKVGDSLTVWVNDFVILDDADARLNLVGPVSFSGAGTNGESGSYGNASFDDVVFTPLDADGNSLVGTRGSVAITSPTLHSALTVGVAATLSGSVSDPDGIALVEVFSGFTKLGNATVSGSSWTYVWSSVPRATLALWARLTDNLGRTLDSAPVTVFAGTGTGNTAPTVTIGQNASVVAPSFGLTGSFADSDGSVSLVQVYLNGNLLGAATLSGSTWTYTVSGLASGSYTFAARAHDNLGSTTDASFIGTVDGNAPPTLTDIANQTIDQGQATGALAFTVGDDATALTALTVTATSSNQSLVPDSALTLGGSGASRTIQVTPISTQSGSAVITVTVNDGAKTASDVFTLTVNGPPVATSIAVSPTAASIAPGSTQQFTAVLQDQYGAALANQPLSFAWTVSGGGTIGSSGLFTAGSAIGSHTVTATASGFSGSANFAIAAPPPADLLISTGFEGYPSSGAVSGTSAPATGDLGIATDTWAGANWSWSSTGLAYTDSAGTIAAGSRALVYSGSTYQFRQVNVSPSSGLAGTVYVRFLVKLASAPATGKNAGAQLVLNNNVTNSDNSRMTGFGVWSDASSTNDFFIRNTNGTESFFGGKAGSGVNLVVAKLTWNGTGFSQIDVWANPTYSDLNSPDASVTFATALSSISELVFRGGSLTGGPLVSVDNLLVATGWSAVVPAPPPVATTLALSPNAASLAPGGTQQFTAVLYDQYGSPVAPQPTFTWSVSAGGSVDASGQFTAGFTPGGPHTLTVSGGGFSTTASVTIDSGLAGTPSIVAYAGAVGVEEFKDVYELSDGTVLVVGTAENLDWLTAPKTQLAVSGTLPSRATGRTPFLLRLSADLQTVLAAWHLPAGQSLDFRWIKSTSKPGAPTGALYLSGACDATSGDYFIARLNGNFVDSAPTGLSWVLVAKAANTYGDNLGLQPWDVGGDGRVAYLHEVGGALRVLFADASGQPMKLADLRGSHWASGATLNDTNRQAGIGSALPTTAVSGVSFPADLRSWTDSDRVALLPDGNGSIKRGTWPLDLFTAVQDKNGGTTGTIEYGYTGYKSVGKYRVGGIALDRDTNDLFLGFNIQSKFWDAPANIEQPDFEPAVIAYSATGTMKWWSRLYHEVVDTDGDGQIDPGETRLSSPDQYVDGLAIDYSASPARLVVNARCHGNNTSNLWAGNAVAANPGGSGFHNQFTGTEGNIHIGWIGKLRTSDGQLQRSTYLAGYFRNTTLTQTPYTDPNLAGWPSHNAGWPNLTTTRAEPGSLRTDANGRVYIVGVGPRMVTTATAHQQLPKITSTVNEGISPWAAFARVFDADLVTLAYSTALTGAWTYPSEGAQPEGADNTDLYGIFPTSSGLLAVGRHRATSGLADGNPVPVSEVPAWAAATPQNVSALFARLPFNPDSSTAGTAPVIVDGPRIDPDPVTGTTAAISASAADPDHAESTLTYTWSTVSTPVGGTATFAANGTHAAGSTTVTFTRAGTYQLRVIATDPSGKTGQATANVVVSPIPTTLALSPASTSVETGKTQQFTATLTDQFGQPITGQTFTWNLSGGGTLSTSGLFAAGAMVGGPHTVTASLGTLSATAQLSVIAPLLPEISLAHTTLSQSAQSGTSTTRPLRITNLGTAALTWNATASVLPTGSGGNITSFTTSAQTGGPSFQWTDISSGSTAIWAPTGTKKFNNDLATVNFPSGFSFPFYGGSYTSVKVSTSGYLSFDSAHSTIDTTNSTLPSADSPPLLVAPAFNRWTVDKSAWVRWKALDADTLVITWNNVQRFGVAAPNRASFQVILKRSGEILFNYARYEPTDRVYTIGIQNSARNTGVLCAFDPGSNFIPTGTASNFAVRLAPSGSTINWLALSPASGTTAANSVNDLTLSFATTGLAVGTYNGTVTVASNDPDEASLQLPVAFTVTGSPVAPNAPSNLNATALSNSQIGLTWNLEGGSPTGHRADYRLSGTTTWTNGPTFTATAESGSVTGLAGGTAYEFRVVATNGAGDSAASNLANATTLSDYTSWIAGYPGAGNRTSATEDADGDGLSNLLEYALGGDPSDPTDRPGHSFGTSGGFLTLTFTPERLNGLTYVVEASSDLLTWSASTLSGLTMGQPYTHTDSVELGSNSRRFLRLKVTQ